jgi:HEAT repeat protein
VNRTKTDKRSDGVSGSRLDKLIDDLRTGDSQARRKATRTLSATPGPDLVAVVAPLLKDEETQVRVSALEILKKTGRGNLDMITALLYDENEDVKVYACKILMEIADPRTLPDLIRKLKEDEENVRNAACAALGRFRDERAVEALLGALEDTDWIKFSAVYALGAIGGDKIVSRLLTLLNQGEEEIASACCEVLIESPDDHVVEAVFDNLKEMDVARQRNCLRVILQKGDEQMLEKLKQKVGQELFEHLLNCVRVEKNKSLQVLRRIARFKSIESCDVIIGVLSEMEPDGEDYQELLDLFKSLRPVWEQHTNRYLTMREASVLPFISACGLEGIQIDEALLTSVYSASSVEVRRMIIANLPSIAAGKALPILKEAITDADVHVKKEAVIVAGLKAVSELKDSVLHLARHGFFDVRVQALRALMSIDRNQALTLVKWLAESGSVEDKKTYLCIVDTIDSENNYPLIRVLLADRDEGVRRAAAKAIGNYLDEPRYVDLFGELLIGRNIPHEALKAIKEKKLTGFRNILMEIFADETQKLWSRYYALAALSSFEDHGLFETFVKGLDDANSLIKIGSLKALSDLNNVAAIEYVRPCLLCKDDDVRSTAEHVIERLQDF